MTVRTTYFAALSNGDVEPRHGSKVFGVVRKPAEWTEQLVDRNLVAVAPPKRLLEAYKSVERAAEENGEENPQRIAWNSVEFEQQYRDYLEKPELQKVLAKLRATGQRTDLWLVCYERDEQYCHRRLLREELTPDWGIPQRPHLKDACQPDEHDLVSPPGIPTRVCQKCGLGSTTLDTHLGHLGGDLA
jgi:uncharacterized protein YeaO (DUF488 family)